MTTPVSAVVLPQTLPRIGWGVFLVVVGTSFAAAFGAGAPLSLLIVFSAVFAFVLRAPYAALYLFCAAATLLGWQISIPAGSFAFVSDIVQGSIDVQVSEVLAGMLLVAWGVRMLLLWRGRHDWHWKPALPLALPVCFLVLAHLLSSFSLTEPNVAAVFKFAFRPIAFVYLSCILLPVNFIRARHRLLTVLSVVAGIGFLYAVNGLLSLFVFEGGLFTIHRARPLLMGGVNWIGGNHNALAEVLLFGAASAMAYATLTRVERARAAAYTGAVSMGVIALLTFARSAWIAAFVALSFLSLTIWRKALMERKDLLVIGGIAIVPLAILLVRSLFTTAVQGSTDTRLMVNEIAWQLFQSSPFVGVGAGTFLEHVAGTYAYVVEFGAPIDAHGVLQKVAAETGMIGLAAFALLMGAGIRHVWLDWRRLVPHSPERTAFAYLIAGVLAMTVYQLFDTTYWTARWWLPIGITLAAGQLFFVKQITRDPDFLQPYG